MKTISYVFTKTNNTEFVFIEDGLWFNDVKEIIKY